MIDQLFTWYTALPLAALLGWFGKKLFGPTVDAIGSAILDLISTFVNKKRTAKKVYLELEELIKKNHTANGHKAFYERKTYLRDRQIISSLSNYGSMMRRVIKSAWVAESRIDSYNESDVFFAAMELFLEELNKKDIKLIFGKYKDNDQAVLWPFLENIEERKPKILSTEVIGYLRQKQKEWKEKYSEQSQQKMSTNPL